MEMEYYQVICAERVTQMTRAYNDIDAVTQLLEEKERDLELAARIGQTLLQSNKELERRQAEQDEHIAEANDKIKQMRHDLAQKEALLQVYLQEESSPETPESERLQSALGVANLSGLQKKVKTLEEENLNLRSQSAALKTETCLEEEKEVDLFKDCIRQLEDYKSQVYVLQEELLAKTDLNLQQQEDITALTAKTEAQEAEIKKVLQDNAETTRRLQAAQEAQKELAAEIEELENKNVDLEVVIEEMQDELKNLKKKQKPSFIRHHASVNSPFLPEGSLALELEDSIRRDVPCPPGYTPRERRQHNKRVMQTAKVVKKSQHSPGASSANESCESIMGSSVRSSLYLSEGEMSETGYGADVDSVYGGSTSTLGRPGIPGSNDLETALRRLTMKRSQESQENLSYRRRRSTYRSDGGESVTSCRTPDSILSNGSFSNLSDFSRLSGISSGFRIPEKLQIVKPMEGSLTLHQWKRLATPHLAGVLEHRPGIQTKGECATDTAEEEIYSLSDFEEDDDYSLHLGKCMEQTSGIYTYTTAKILHPSDEYGGTLRTTEFVEPMFTSDLTVSYTSTPRTSATVSYSRLNDTGTSTFSMSAGLAIGLQERGIQDGRSSSSQTSSCTLGQRYGNIVTETISSATQSQTEVLYTSANTRTSSTTSAGRKVPVDTDDAYLHLADKVKDIGLNSILSIAKRSGIAPVKLDPVDSGLNVIMSIKRNKGAVNRCMAEKSQTISYSRYVRPKICQRVNPKVDASTALTSVTDCTSVTMTTGLLSSSTTKSDRIKKVSDDGDTVKTLPPPHFHKRPKTLAISGKTSGIHTRYKTNEKDYDFGLDVSAIVSGAQGEPALTSGVTISENTLSDGLLSHLTSIYARTRDLMSSGGGAASAALLPSKKT